MGNKIIFSEERNSKMNEEKNKIIIFSVREIKSNPFRNIDFESNRTVINENDISFDYKIEMAMEYELIYNSHFFDQ